MPNYSIPKNETLTESNLNKIIQSIDPHQTPNQMTLADKIVFCLENNVKIYQQ